MTPIDQIAPNLPSWVTFRPDRQFNLSEVCWIVHLILLISSIRGTMGASVRSGEHYAQALSLPPSLPPSLPQEGEATRPPARAREAGPTVLPSELCCETATRGCSSPLPLSLPCGRGFLMLYFVDWQTSVLVFLSAMTVSAV